jgi:hypothetical protein
MFASISVSTESIGRLQTPEAVTPTWQYYHFHKKVVIHSLQMTTRGPRRILTANHQRVPTATPAHRHGHTIGRAAGEAEVVGKLILINNRLESPVTDVLARQIAHLMRREAEHAGVDLRVWDLLEQFTSKETVLIYPSVRRAPQAPTTAYRDHQHPKPLAH